MMQLNVAQLLREPVGARRSFRFQGPMEEGAAQGEAGLLRTKEGVLVSARVTSDVRSVCPRCLSDYVQRVATNFEEEFFPVIDIETGKPVVSAKKEEDDFTIDEHHILDITEAVRQYTLLAIPMKGLCKADCKGLCPRCGANWNERECTCPKEEVDPAWEELRRLWALQGER